MLIKHLCNVMIKIKQTESKNRISDFRDKTEL